MTNRRELRRIRRCLAKLVEATEQLSAPIDIASYAPDQITQPQSTYGQMTMPPLYLIKDTPDAS